MPIPPPGGIPCGSDWAERDTAITLSILNIMFAVSVADFMICSFTLSGSTIPSFSKFVMTPLITSTPANRSPAFCFARN